MSIEIKSFSDILSDVQEAFTKALGADINFDPSSPTGMLSNEIALSFLELYTVAQLAQSACLITEAQNDRLDDLIALIGMSRGLGEKTTCSACTITGTASYTLPAGSQAKTDTGVIFYSASDVTLDGTGHGEVDFISADFGQFTVEPGQLTTIVDTNPDWTSVNNPTAGVGGETTETDGEVRQRHLLMPQYYSQGYQGSIKAAVLAIPGVKDVYVYVNYTSGVSPAPWASPANSVWVIVQYEDWTLDTKIAEAIFSKIAPVSTYNEVGKGIQHEKDVDITSQVVNIKWNEAEPVLVNFQITLQEDTEFTIEDEQAVKDAISSYMLDNQTISGTLYYSKIYAIAVDAAKDSIIEQFVMAAGTSPTPTDNVDISPNFYQVLIMGNVDFVYGA